MTTIRLLAAIRRGSIADRALTATAGSFALALVLAGSAAPAGAQQPPQAPPPPQPAVSQKPAPILPPSAPLPPAPAAGAAAARTVVSPTAVVPAARRAPAAVGIPVDSIRPKAEPVSVPPANAVALCRDGTYLVPPATVAGCTSHGGLQVAMTQRAAPPAPGSRVAAVPVAARAPMNEPPPAGATMRCKDGTYLSGAPNASACATHNGLAVVLPAPRPAPPAPVARTSPPRPAPRGAVAAPPVRAPRPTRP